MNQGIVICTWAGGKEQLTILLDSLKGTPYPIVIVVNAALDADWLDNLSSEYLVFRMPWDGYELGAIKVALQNTNLDEFVLLQDTFEVLDISLFDRLFNDYPSQSVAYNPHFQMYLGKFRREALEKMKIPEVSTKAEAVLQEERFTKAYMALESTVVFNPDFIDNNFYDSWEERWGRKNLVLRDQYLVKRKGIWSASQIIN
jgi:hypothetical protein